MPTIRWFRAHPVQRRPAEPSSLSVDLDAVAARLEAREHERRIARLTAEAEARVAIHWNDYNHLCREACDLPISWSEFYNRAMPFEFVADLLEEIGPEPTPATWAASGVARPVRQLEGVA
jgi:hypothetical protein